jgi:hypothetical protein
MQTKIKDGIRRVALYRAEECRVVLADIVVSRAVPESASKSIVIRDRRVREAPNPLRVIPSGGAAHRPPMFSYCEGWHQAFRTTGESAFPKRRSREKRAGAEHGGGHRAQRLLCMSRASTQDLLDGEIAVPDNRGVSAGHRPARARAATRLAGPRVGAFWKPGDPALISFPGPAWLGAR